ncbi:adenylate/guanylate cyclase domain-containing protein [Conexibacter sp. SYSU D00693]|uniref:adenylate/guanylate cyclase domain-containing protein n=1 Tax=Conexibacter sp. SYSU D00693 TaxID=2812560 RepID=UPI00196A6800|nr:adenylate/guanylate cyclase domain-containing protein [Conexibacter sp. SYSU D00693]
MASPRRRPGIFDALPRSVHRRWPSRYLDAVAAACVLNGAAVAAFGALALVLYVDVDGGELAAFAGVSALAFLVEAAVAGLRVRRSTPALRQALRGGDADLAAAWAQAARLPLVLARRPELVALGVAGAAGACAVLAALLDLPAREAALLLPAAVLLYASAVVLRFVGVDLLMRPVLEELGGRLTGVAPPDGARVSLLQRLVVTIPMVTWGTALMAAGLLTDDTRDLDTIGLASVVAFGVSAVVSTWLGLVLADAVSGPLVDLRDANRRVGDGDLSVRVPVVSTDETGELSATFNAMVAGLQERERLHEAFGAFVDPSLTSRVLAEGTDLRGEELEASVLFVDVRGFTSFAEAAAPPDVVAALNVLFEAVVPVVQRHGGHANKFVGDGLLAVFGAPERREDHAARAVAAAREVAAVVGRGEAGPLRVGVGVHSGRVVAGTVGGGGRRDFTVIGDAVNTAARVEAATRETGDDVLVTATTLDLLGDGDGAWVERAPLALRGKRSPVRLFAPR